MQKMYDLSIGIKVGAKCNWDIANDLILEFGRSSSKNFFLNLRKNKQ